MAVIPIKRGRRPEVSNEAFAGILRTGDGAELYLQDSGGSLPALFFIYGLGCSDKHWKYPMAHLAAEGEHRIVWMDFRGHGRSAPLAGNQRLSIPMILGDVSEVCEKRGIKGATFLGQSMGGCIALRLASEQPELVRSLVLLASPGRDPSLAFPVPNVTRKIWQGLIELNRRAPLVLELAHKASMPYVKSRFFHVPFREYIRHTGFNASLSKTEDIDEYLRKVYEVSPNRFYDLAAEVSDFDIATLAPPVKAPTLVIAGAKDTVVPLAESRRLAEHLPRGELAIVPHGSHCPHFDDPRLVGGLISDFLSRHGV